MTAGGVYHFQEALGSYRHHFRLFYWEGGSQKPTTQTPAVWPNLERDVDETMHWLPSGAIHEVPGHILLAQAKHVHHSISQHS